MTNTISKIKDKKKIQKILLTAFAAIFIVAISFLIYKKFNHSDPIQELPVSQMIHDVDNGFVKSIKVLPDYLASFKVELKEGSKCPAEKPTNSTKDCSISPIKYMVSGPHFDIRDIKDFERKGVEFGYHQPPMDTRFLPSYLILILFGVLVIVTVGQSFGLSLMKVGKKSNVKFIDVAGNEEAKTAMQEVVDYLESPKRYESFGAKFPKGIIMDGPPGTGKTLLAKAIAGEAGANFMAVSGSDFGSMFVSVSGMKVQGIFARARRSAPCVLFIDEIDAVGGHRLSEGTAVAREMSSVLNSLLVQMDGFESNSGVIVIAATNRIELLDPALLRSGRFDRHIHVQLPTLNERDQILRLHAKSIKTGDFDFSVVSKACIGMSGADLANVVNQAALIAVNESATSVETKHGIQGRNRVVMGDARLSQARNMTSKTKNILAIHEAGHALIGMVHGPDEVTCISIIPRGKSLGQTMFSPSDEVLVHDKTNLVARIRLLLGGRAAEQYVGNIQTTGASDDLVRASKIATDIFGQYGMGEDLLCSSNQSSDAYKHEIEGLANKLLSNCLKEAIETIQEHIATFDAIVEELLANEEIDESGIKKIMERTGFSHTHL